MSLSTSVKLVIGLVALVTVSAPAHPSSPR